MFSARNAIDGDDETYWAGGFNGSQECWIEVTLEKGHVITNLEVKFSYAKEIYLQAIVDGIWVNVKTITAPEGCKKDELTSASVGTFIRPTKRLRLIQGERHPDEELKSYNLFNCGMEIVHFQLQGFPAPEISLIDKQASPAVFFSYNWSHQEIVNRLVFETEKSL